MNRINKNGKSNKLLFILLISILTLTVIGCSKENSVEKASEETETTKEENNIDEKAELIVLSQDTDKEIEVIATGFVADILNKEFTKAYEEYEFSEEMKAAIDEATLGQILIGTKMQYGELVEDLTNYIIEADDYRAVYVQLEFEKDKMAFQVSFDLDDKIAGFFFQEFKEVDEGMSETNNSEETKQEEVLASYEEISFGLEDYSLPAIISTTENTELMVVMVHGSGPNDRDVTVGPNKVFKDLEQGLLKANYGSFRYDKRTLVHGSKVVNDASFGLYEETVEDSVLAVEEIRKKYGDDMKIVVLGHSQGGHSIPFIAKELEDKGIEVNGFIIMAGNYSPINELIEMQIEYLGKLDGDFTDAEKQQLKDVVDGFKPLINGDDFDPEAPLFYVTAGYWNTFIDYKISEDVIYVNQPTLVLNGDRDYQVPASEVEMWKNVLNPDISTFQIFEGVNHLMIKGTGEPDPSEYYNPGHVDEDVIRVIVDFLSDL